MPAPGHTKSAGDSGLLTTADGDHGAVPLPLMCIWKNSVEKIHHQENPPDVEFKNEVPVHVSRAGTGGGLMGQIISKIFFIKTTGRLIMMIHIPVMKSNFFCKARSD